MPEPVSTELLQWMQKAQVLGLQSHPELPEAIRQLLNRVDHRKRLLTCEEGQILCNWSGIDAACIEHLQDQVERLVHLAKQGLQQQAPWLMEPGGALYPTERAEACWQDCWQFMRVIILAVAVDRPAFTDPDGMEALRILYGLMNVPVEGLSIALDELNSRSQQAIHQSEWIRERQALAAAFAHLASALNKPVVKSCEALG